MEKETRGNPRGADDFSGIAYGALQFWLHPLPLESRPATMYDAGNAELLTHSSGFAFDVWHEPT